MYQSYDHELVFHAPNAQLQTLLKQIKQAINNLDQEHPLFGAQIELSIAKLNPQLASKQTNLFVWGEDFDEAFMLEDDHLTFRFQTLNEPLNPNLIQTLVKTFNCDYAWLYQWDETIGANHNGFDAKVSLTYSDPYQLKTRSKLINGAKDYDHLDQLLKIMKNELRLQFAPPVKPKQTKL